MVTCGTCADHSTDEGFIMLKLLALSLAFTSVAQAHQEGLAWTGKWHAQPALSERGKAVISFAEKAAMAGWEEVNALISQMTGVANAVISPEYAHYRAGFKVMGRSAYVENSMDFKDPPELNAITEQYPDTLPPKTAFKGGYWLHMIQPMTNEEANCLTITKAPGTDPSGCGDQWQTGITADKVVCFGDYTYLKCHVECMESIYNHKIPTTPGFCADAELPAPTEAPISVPFSSDIEGLKESF